MTNTPACSPARATRAVSAALTPNGFSTRTGFPASMASSARSAWNRLGAATYTASTALSATAASYEPYDRSTPNLEANARARSGEREPTATTRCELFSCSVRVKSAAISPGARTAHRNERPSRRARALNAGSSIPLRSGMAHDVPLAGNVLDHALALQDLQ